MRVAAIDCGSNTFILLVADFDHQGQVSNVIADEVRYVRLGQNMDQSKNFHPEALERADRALADFSELIKKYQPQKVGAVATSAARDAKNKDAFFDIFKKYNIPVTIISGDQEAQLTYQGSGVSFAQFAQGVWVLDIGGGSTELIIGKNDQIYWHNSFDLGGVRLTERHNIKMPITFNYQGLQDQIIQTIKDSVPAQFIKDFSHSPLVAVGGTPVELLRIVWKPEDNFDIKKIHGQVLSKELLVQGALELSQLSTKQIEEKYKTPLGRADVLFAGALLLLATLEVLEKESFIISTYGIRYGLAHLLAEDRAKFI